MGADRTFHPPIAAASTLFHRKSFLCGKRRCLAFLNRADLGVFGAPDTERTASPASACKQCQRVMGLLRSWRNGFLVYRRLPWPPAFALDAFGLLLFTNLGPLLLLAGGVPLLPFLAAQWGLLRDGG